MPRKLPALRPQRIIATLEKCGLSVTRQTGSHVVLHKPGLARPVIIARHNRELAPRAVAHLLTQGEVSEREFLARL